MLVVNRRWAEWAGFAEFARRHIPPDEPVLVVQQASGVRGPQRFCRRDVNIFDHFWMLYSLVPRPYSCGPGRRAGPSTSAWRQGRCPRGRTPTRTGRIPSWSAGNGGP